MQIRSDSFEHRGAIPATFAMGAPDGFGVSFLAPRLGRLTARHPELKIQLVPVPRSFCMNTRFQISM